MEPISFFYLVSLLASVVTAFLFRKDLRSKKLFILLPYLVYVFLQELILTIGRIESFITSTAPVYNIYRPVTAIVFAYIYYSIPFMRSLRKLIAGITLLYLAIVLINYCFVESILITSSYLTLARGFVVTFCAILFLFRYFNLDNAAEEKYWRPLIWITAGVAVFYPVVSISLTFQKFLAADNAFIYGPKLYQLIPQVMSIFMYSCFSYAFYLCRKKN